MASVSMGKTFSGAPPLEAMLEGLGSPLSVAVSIRNRNNCRYEARKKITSTEETLEMQLNSTNTVLLYPDHFLVHCIAQTYPLMVS